MTIRAAVFFSGDALIIHA